MQPSIVVVMGPTGAGKSTFIQYATGQDNHGVGHRLRSYTAEINEIKCTDHNGRDVVFVDTPGFDDTYKSDIEILSQIAEWLVTAYGDKVNIEAILYLHKISDNRMAGSPLKNLQLFANLCGNIAMSNVTIVTTMWGLVREDTGTAREKELKDVFWKGLIENGCKVERFGDTRESAWKILGYTSAGSAQVLISTQILDKRKSLKDTAAGIALNRQLKKLKKDQKAADRKLQELATRQKDGTVTKQLTERKLAIETKIAHVNEQMQILKRGWFQNLIGSHADVPNVPTE